MTGPHKKKLLQSLFFMIIHAVYIVCNIQTVTAIVLYNSSLCVDGTWSSDFFSVLVHINHSCCVYGLSTDFLHLSFE